MGNKEEHIEDSVIGNHHNVEDNEQIEKEKEPENETKDKTVSSKDKKKLSLHQTEQVESKRDNFILKEEIWNNFKKKEIVTKDKKLEEKSIDQLKANNDLTNDDISILSHRDAQKECKRRGLNAGGKKEEMKKRLLIDNNTICLEDENENSEIENDTAYDTYPSGTSLLTKLRKSIETSAGFLAPQKILLSKGEKKLSLHQTEQVESKLKEETKNPLESKEIVTKDKKLEEKSIDQLKGNNDLTNDDISILSHRDAQKECKRRGLNAGGKKEEMKKRILIDNNTICLEDENENSEIENDTAYDTYPSGTSLLTKLRKSIETSAGFLAPQKILLSKGEKKLSLHQTEQVESKLKEETK